MRSNSNQLPPTTPSSSLWWVSTPASSLLQVLQQPHPNLLQIYGCRCWIYNLASCGRCWIYNLASCGRCWIHNRCYTRSTPTSCCSSGDRCSTHTPAASYTSQYHTASSSVFFCSSSNVLLHDHFKRVNPKKSASAQTECKRSCVGGAPIGRQPFLK
jgi:hypothetical protein